MIQIIIKSFAGKNFPLEVEPFHVPKNVKEKIQQIEGIPLDHQRLVIAGHPLEENVSLENQQIQNGSSVYLILRPTASAPPQGQSSTSMPIFVKMLTGRRVTLTVDPFETIENIKEKIQELEGIQASVIGLLYSGKSLHNRRCLADYGIQRESTCHVVLQSHSG